MKKFLFAGATMLALGAGCAGDVAVANFQECVDAGYPVQESYPRKCAADGVTYVEDIGNAEEKKDLIRVEEPDANESVGTPFTITGEARGGWYFEATFPVKLVGEDGDVLAEGYATADGEWMTEEFVPFTAELEFDAQPQHATLVLSKANASGLPEHDDELRVPVRIE